MNPQIIFVGVCLLIAIIFIGKKIYMTFQRKGCNCDATCKNRTPACIGGGPCPSQKELKELRPR